MPIDYVWVEKKNMKDRKQKVRGRSVKKMKDVVSFKWFDLNKKKFQFKRKINTS